jgi:hypothetical protein
MAISVWLRKDKNLQQMIWRRYFVSKCAFFAWTKCCKNLIINVLKKACEQKNVNTRTKILRKTGPSVKKTDLLLLGNG